MKYSKVEGHLNLVRDEQTKAILNINNTEYENYIKLKKIKEDDNNRIKNLESDVNDMKSDLNEIKNLLRNLINEPR
jgi:hypothetical protein